MNHEAPTAAAPAVLLVEDDDDIRDIVSEVLEDRGYRVTVAENGARALDLLRTGEVRPQLILLDLMMPDMDGRQFVASQREDARLTGIPVVVVTAAGRAQVRVGELDVAGWLSKPVELDRLLATVAQFCEPPSRRGASGGPTDRLVQFVERRRRDLLILRDAVKARDFDEVRAIADNLRQGGSGYGFDEIGQIGDRMRAAASADDPAAVSTLIDELASFVDRFHAA